jgi:hypothetical protein
LASIVGSGRSTLTNNYTSCTTRTNNNNGFTLAWAATNEDMAGPNSDVITQYAPTAPDTTEVWSINSSVSAWAGTIQDYSSGDTNTHRDDTRDWGTTTSPSYTTAKFLNLTAGYINILSTNNETTNSGDTFRAYFGAEVGASRIQLSGTYSTTAVLRVTTD